MQLSITTNAQIVRQGLENFAAEIPKIGRRRIYEMMVRVRARLAKGGAKPSYPIHWDSEKQRRAFFATGGFGRGIPSKRTGELEGGWQVVRLGDSGYRLENASAHAKYVTGDAYGQVHSGIHKGRWPIAREVVEQEASKLPDEVEAELNMVARREKLA